LKGHNVFLTNNFVKLGDFGISKKLDKTLDMASTFMGTVEFIAPEMIRHLKYNNSVDIWALGCILH
jgi:NIMA (never in mitosis gene a)-related kinase